MNGISFTDEFDRSGEPLGSGWKVSAPEIPAFGFGIPAVRRAGTPERLSLEVTVDGVLHRAVDVEIEAGDVVGVRRCGGGIPVAYVTRGEEVCRTYPMHAVEPEKTP